MLLSESLGVPSARPWKFRVFDSYLGVDSLLHVDPARLKGFFDCDPDPVEEDKLC